MILVISPSFIPWPSRFSWLVCSDGGLHGTGGLAQEETLGCSILELLPLSSFPPSPNQDDKLPSFFSRQYPLNVGYICAPWSPVGCKYLVLLIVLLWPGCRDTNLAWDMVILDLFFYYSVFEMNSLYPTENTSTTVADRSGLLSPLVCHWLCLFWKWLV